MPGIQTAKELREKRANLWEQQKAVIDAAEARGDGMTAEETEQFDRIEQDMVRIEETVKRIEAHEARGEQSRGIVAGRQDRTEEIREAEEREQRESASMEQRDRVNKALSAWSLGEADQSDIQEIRNAGFQLDRTGKKIDLSLWGTARESEFRRMPRVERRAQSTTDASGGFTIPETLVRNIESALLDFGGMRESGATVIRTASGEKMTFPVVDDTGNTGRLLAENTAVTSTDITFAEKQLDAYKYSSDQILASVELLQDSAVDLPSFIGEKLGERIARITNQHFTTGTGSGQPNGVVTAASSAATTGSATVVTYDELQTLLHSVDPAYRRQDAGWMFSDATLKVVKQMKDGDGRPLWVPGLSVREPDSLLGYRYTVNQDVADIAASAKAILFGAFRYYHIRDVVGLTLLRLDERYADNLQVAWIAFSRHDGELISNGSPIKFLTQAA